MEQKTEKIKKKKEKIRIRTIHSKGPLPGLRDISINKLVDLLSDQIKNDADKYVKISKSLEKHGYDPENKGYIRIREYFDRGLVIVDGRKRVAILGKNNKSRKKIKVMQLLPIIKRMRNSHIKTKNMNKIVNEIRQKINTKDSK
jgi:hypothetical protein